MAGTEGRQNPCNRKMLEQIYDKHYRAMLGFAQKLMTDAPCSVEDVLQNAFIRIMPHLEAISQMTDAGARAYILKTVETEVLKFLQKEQIPLKYTVPLDEQYIDSIADKTNILDDLCEKEKMEDMVRILHGMPGIYRNVLNLYYVSHMNLKEIAAHFHLPYATVKKRFQRGKDLLIQQMTRKGGPYEK